MKNYELISEWGSIYLAWQPVIAAYQVNINTKEERDFILDIIDEWYHKND